MGSKEKKCCENCRYLETRGYFFCPVYLCNNPANDEEEGIFTKRKVLREVKLTSSCDLFKSKNNNFKL